MFAPGPTSRQDFGFDPRALGSLILWNDASTYTGALSGNTWSNRSTNPRYTMNYTGTPTYVTAATAGLTYGVHAFATGDAQNVTPAPYIFNAMTFVFLSRKTSGGRVFQGTSCNILYGYHGTSKNMLFINDWLYQPNTPTDSVWDIYSIRVTDSNGYEFYRNGAALSTSFCNRVINPCMTGLATNASGAFPGETSAYQMAEVMLYDTLLNFNDVRSLEGYLAWKWGLVGSLNINHPFKSNAPTMTNFVPDKFHVTPRCWFDFADNTTYTTLSGNYIQKYQTKGSAAVFASWETIYSGNNTYLPQIRQTALNTFSTATFVNTGSLWTSSFGLSGSQRALFSVLQSTSNISTAANGLSNPLPNNEFFNQILQPQTVASDWASSVNNDKAGATRGTVYTGCGVNGVQNNVYTAIGNYHSTYPIQLGWTIASIIDNQSTIANMNRISYYSTSNNNKGQSYFTRATQQNSNLAFNSTLQFNVPGAYNVSNIQFQLHISYSTNKAHHCGMEAAEVIFFDQYIGNNDSLKIDGYLGWKWGLNANFSSIFAFSRIPPALATGFNATKSNYFTTARAVTYLPLQTDASDIGIFPQLVRTNGTVTYGAIGGKTGASFNNNTANFLSFTNQFQNPMTTCFWCYANNATAYYTMVSFCDINCNAASNYTLEFNTSNSLVTAMATNIGNWQLSTAGTYTNVAVNNSTWFSVALVSSSNVGTLYINGTNVQTITGNVTMNASANTIFLGKSGSNTRAFSGYIRHFTLFNRALNQTEITAWHTNTT